MKDIKVLGIDLAKSIFQIHGTDIQGKCLLRKRLSRAKLPEFIAQLKPCLIGIEASGSAHFWAREFKKLGHEVKIMSPQFVKPYVRSNKNDRNDAQAIAEAVTRPFMKFVPIKKIEQHDILMLHRARELLVKQKTALANQLRGLLAEYGIIIEKGISHIAEIPSILERYSERLTPLSQATFSRLYEHFKKINDELKHYDAQIERIAKEDVRCQELLNIEGVGVLAATAMVAAIGDAKEFKRGREVSAWLGLVPRHYASANKLRLCGISKRGDRYLRTLLIHGARSVVNVCDKKSDRKSIWLADKKQRCGYNIAAVAMANKTARIIWAVLAHGECYRKSEVFEEQGV